jgi:hypothetical protein
MKRRQHADHREPGPCLACQWGKPVASRHYGPEPEPLGSPRTAATAAEDQEEHPSEP